MRTTSSRLSLRLGPIALMAATLVVGCDSTKTATKTAEEAPRPGAASPAPSGGTADPGVSVRVNPTLRSMAANPTPPPTAQKRNTIGRGALAVNTGNSPGDVDSFWMADVDIDSDGIVESVEVLWDDDVKMLYVFGTSDFICESGAPGAGAMLVALNGPANPRNRAVGSGFFALEIDALDCAAGTIGIWGCRFDASGATTSCGWVAITATSTGAELTEGMAVR